MRDKMIEIVSDKMREAQGEAECWYGHKFYEAAHGVWVCDCGSAPTLYTAPPAPEPSHG